MAELVGMLREQAVNALTNDERYRQRVVPEVGIFDVPLSIPASLGQMGRTQRLAQPRRGNKVDSGGSHTCTPTPSGRTRSTSDVPQPSSAPSVRPPPAAPSRGRSPGGAASSSTDLPVRVGLEGVRPLKRSFAQPLLQL